MAGSKIAEKMKVRTSQSTKESPKKTTKRLSAKSRKPEEAGKKTRKHPRFGKRPIDAMFPLYIHRVLKQVHPEMKLSMKAITILNSFAVDMMERLCGEMPMLMQVCRQACVHTPTCSWFVGPSHNGIA
jgi:histone H2B